MSWLTYVILIFTALAVFRGARKGFLRMALSMGFLVLVLLITIWLNPKVGDYLRSQEGFYGKIEDSCSKYLDSNFWKEVPEEAGKTPEMQENLIEQLPVPQVLKDKLTENNNTEVYDLLQVESFKDYLAGSLAYWICSAIAFVVTFVLAVLVVQLIMCALDLLTELPGQYPGRHGPGAASGVGGRLGIFCGGHHAVQYPGGGLPAQRDQQGYFPEYPVRK